MKSWPRYINSVIIGVIMFLPFFIFFVPFFMYMDWAFEDNEKDYVTPAMKQSFWELFKRELTI